MQLEDLDVTVADHVQKVMHPNFAAAWEEVGEDNELEDTYELPIKTLDGMGFNMIYLCWILTFQTKYFRL